jgi:hypothetical protein
VRILQEAIGVNDTSTEDADGSFSLEAMLTTEEVSQVVEEHIEGLLGRVDEFSGR